MEQLSGRQTVTLLSSSLCCLTLVSSYITRTNKPFKKYNKKRKIIREETSAVLKCIWWAAQHPDFILVDLTLIFSLREVNSLPFFHWSVVQFWCSAGHCWCFQQWTGVVLQVRTKLRAWTLSAISATVTRLTRASLRQPRASVSLGRP